MDHNKKPGLNPTISDLLNQCIDEPFIKVKKNMEELRGTLNEIKGFMAFDFDEIFRDKVKREHWHQLIYMVEVEHLAIFGTLLGSFRSYINEFGHDFNFDVDLRNLYKKVELEKAIVRKTNRQKKIKAIKGKLKKSLGLGKSGKKATKKSNSLSEYKQGAFYSEETGMVIGEVVPKMKPMGLEKRKSLPPDEQKEEKPSCFGVSCNDRMLCGPCPGDIFVECFDICKENEEKKTKPKIMERTVPRPEF